MHSLRQSALGAFGATALAATALARQVPAQPAPMTMTTASPGDRALANSMDKMGGAMAAPMSGNTDQDFVRMMVAHHEGAVAMAQAELNYGKDPFLRDLARNIVTSQSAEIRQMRAWQAKHPRAAK